MRADGGDAHGGDRPGVDAAERSLERVEKQRFHPPRERPRARRGGGPDAPCAGARGEKFNVLVAWCGDVHEVVFLPSWGGRARCGVGIIVPIHV